MPSEEALDDIFRYPLMDALTHRRTRRFGRGYELHDKTFEFSSDKEPIPLTDEEVALLAWAAHGISGLSFAEAQLSTNVHNSWSGRTHPSPCNDQHTYLPFVNDDGAFLYDPPPATKIIEIESKEERKKILDIYHQHTQKFLDERPFFPKEGWLQSNEWLINRPGSTLFFPLIDLTAEYINFMLYAFDRDGYQVLDDDTGEPAGIKKYVESGRLGGPSLPLFMTETFVLNVCIAQCHYKAQNVALLAEGMGLGVLIFSGFTPMIILGGTPLSRGLEFRFVSGKNGIPNPVGKDGLIEALCPPYVDNMDQAVDAIVDLKYGPEGIYTDNYEGATPFKDFDKFPERMTPYKEDTVQITKDFCNYVYDKYRRFPAYVDTIQAPVCALFHHIDEDFYKKYYPPEVLTDKFHNHMARWHEGK